MIKFLTFSLIIVFMFNFFLHFSIEKQDQKIERLLIENKKIKEEIKLVKINFSFLTRPENLKKLNKDFFYLEPYSLSDIKVIWNSIEEKNYDK